MEEPVDLEILSKRHSALSAGSTDQYNFLHLLSEVVLYHFTVFNSTIDETLVAIQDLICHKTHVSVSDGHLKEISSFKFIEDIYRTFKG